MKVICLSGKAGSGKDAVGEIMESYLNDQGCDVLSIGFGDLVKFIASSYFHWDGDKSTEYGRYILQFIGTEIVRSKNADYWVRFVIDLLHFFPEEWDYVLVTDARFVNEVENIKREFDTRVVRVERPNLVSKLTEEQQKHISETELDSYDFDFVINNDGSLEDLEEKVVKFIKENL